MERMQLEGQWNQLKGKVREKWGKLTNDDVEAINGKYDQLVGKLQEKYGKTREDIKREVDSW